MDFQEQINQQIVALFESGRIEEIVNKQVNEAVEYAIKESLNSYGGFRSKLKDVLDKQLNIDTSSFNILSYNHSVLQIVQKKLDARMDEFLNEHLAKALNEILEPIPTSIKLSGLVEKFIEHHKDDLETCGEITCLVEEDDWGGWNFRLDKEADKEAHRCEIYAGVNKEGEIYYLRMDGEDPKNKLFLGRKFGFERYLFQLYAVKAKIENDENSVVRGFGDY